MMGTETGFTGTMKVMDNKVLYMAGHTVSCRSLKVPQPRLDWTEAEFEFNFKLTSAMVLYVGVPTMGRIIGKRNFSTILSMTVVVVIRD